MAMTKTLIISNALALLGHAPITTLDEPDDLTLAAEQAYDLLIPGVLSRNNWRFAVQLVQLSESIEVAPDPWNAIYFLPADYLKLIMLRPQVYDFDIYQNKKLYSATTGELWMEYVFQPDPAYFPARFTEYVVYEIAAYLALSNAQRPDYYQVLEAKRQNAFAMAAASETQNRPQFSQLTFPVLDNRGISESVDNSTNLNV